MFAITFYYLNLSIIFPLIVDISGMVASLCVGSFFYDHDETRNLKNKKELWA